MPEITDSSRLLSLPPEIRTRIFHSVLRGYKFRVMDSYCKKFNHRALLHVCQQIRNETIAMFYREAVFIGCGHCSYGPRDICLDYYERRLVGPRSFHRDAKLLNPGIGGLTATFEPGRLPQLFDYWCRARERQLNH